ncbi:DUF262 domain-containing protein [Leuconostoc pseudomesenteroides]|uniref:DUF262 domain-containing protein n=1 Tax=Leuconostoc pseudomesenteroides TaxID=33968 RepID=UPI0040359E1E
MLNSLIEIPQPARYKIEELFKDKNFVVPVYQRKYSWNQQEIDDLWNDMSDLLDETRDNHFFGPIVTFRNNLKNQQEVIDGQQRMTTSQIFLAVLRDISKSMLRENTNLSDDSRDDLRDINRIITKLIRGENGQPDSLMVQQTTELRKETPLQEYFHAIVHGGPKNLPQKDDAIRNMDMAYSVLKKSVESLLKTKIHTIERIDLLSTLVDAFLDHFYVIMVSAPTQTDAFIIFETLNSRGKDLKASDIIKNHLMSMLQHDLDKADHDWQIIEDKLDGDSDRITRFIRAYWASKKSLVTEASLYRSLSKELNTARGAQQFLTDLIELVNVYDVLENPLKNKNNKMYFANHLVTEEIDILSRLHVSLYHPIVLALCLKKKNEIDTAKILKKVINVFIRHRTIINDGTNKLEPAFANIAQRIYKEELVTVTDINNILTAELLKTDSEILASWSVLSKDGGQRGQKKWTLVYLLSEIYQNISDFNYYDSAFIEDKYELVHIGNDSEVQEDMINRIGNWTIIEKGFKYSETDSKTERIIKLQKSHLTVNKQISGYLTKNEWNNEAIETRQKEYAKHITQLW